MRRSLHAACFVVCLLLASTAAGQTGVHVPELAVYDTRFGAFFERHGVPGAAVAVSKEGRLVYARGFGYADVEERLPVQPDSRFRIASISKPITATAILKLVEDGKLDLDEAAFSFFDDLPGYHSDERRLSDITVRHLLHHAAGWDNTQLGYDPMFYSNGIAQAVGTQRPTELDTIIRFMRSRPLRYDPGTRFSYSNFSYALLGAIVERVSGQPYEEFVLDMYAETGITNTQMGRTRLEDRLPGEVRYYYNNGATWSSVFPPHQQVPVPYGGFYLEPVGAAGAWVSSAPDILRILEAVDGRPGRPDILSSSTIDMMTARPPWESGTSWYGMGFYANGRNWWHTGALPGNRGFVIRLQAGEINIVTLMNTRFDSDNDFILELNNLMVNTGSAVSRWPTHDLFEVNVSAGEMPGIADAATLDVWPNPIRDRASITFEMDSAGPVHVAVYDVLGRTVDVLHDGLAHGLLSFDLNAGRYPAGVYIVRATTNGNEVSRLISVVR